MAISYTVDNYGGTNRSLNARAATNFKIITGSWSVPSSYAPGGITVNLATLGFNPTQVIFADFVCYNGPVAYDYANDMLLFYSVSATGTANYTEIASDTDIANECGYFCVMGFGTK